MDPRQRTASKVASAISDSGLTRLELSELTGIPKTTLLRKVNGHAPFTLDDIASIGAALGVRPDTLIDFEGVAA